LINLAKIFFHFNNWFSITKPIISL